MAKNMGGLVSKLQHIVPEYTPSEGLLAQCDVDRHDFALRRGMERAYLVTPMREPAPPQARAV